MISLKTVNLTTEASLKTVNLTTEAKKILVIHAEKKACHLNRRKEMPEDQ
jgi:hypothetical protein